MNKTNIWTDLVGVVASIACAIHCAAMPFIVGFLPAMGLTFLADDSFHKVMVGVCSLLAASAFIPGLRRHGRLLPLIVAIVGLAMISIAAFALEDECCSSCDLTTSTASTEVQLGAEACCEHCVAEPGKPIVASTQPKTSDTSITSSFFPWITPLGGLLLVTAHLTNRRFSCLCGCCASE
ncbi:MAG: MerC domain-containing protein [Rubripirellula sp.]